MNKVLVLTDFSKNAKKAATTAIDVADKMNADILLFNAYTAFPFLPTGEFVAWPPEYYMAFKEESSAKIKKEKNRLSNLIANKSVLKRKINITYLTAEGTVAEHLHSLINDREVCLIIMGGREKTAGSFLFGSDIHDVIKKASCPLLIVNSKMPDITLNNVVFATDLDPKDLKTVSYLLSQSKVLHFHLHVCHVSQPPVFLPDFNEEDAITHFMSQLSKLNYENLTYKGLKGDNIAKELDKYSKKIEADMFVLVHKKHSIFWRTLNQSPSKTLIRHQKYPILIIPENWKTVAN